MSEQIFHRFDPSVAAELDRLVTLNETELSVIFLRRHNSIVEQNEVLRSVSQLATSKGWWAHAQIIDILWRCNMFSDELALHVELVSLERNDAQRSITAKHLATTVFEISNDTTAMLGGLIRKALTALGLIVEFDARLRQNRKPLDQFVKDNGRYLNGIRNNLAAHRNKDALSLHEGNERFDVHEVQNLAVRLGNIINDMGPVLQEVYSRSVTVDPSTVPSRK